MDLSAVDLYSTTPPPPDLDGLRVVSHAGTRHLQLPDGDLGEDRSFAAWQRLAERLEYGYGHGPTRVLDHAVDLLNPESVALILANQGQLPPALARHASGVLLTDTLQRAVQIPVLLDNPSGPLRHDTLVLQETIVGLLLAVGARPSLKVLSAAAGGANPRLLQRLLARPPADGWGFTSEDAHKQGTPLHTAALRNHWSNASDTIDRLLDAGVPIDQKTREDELTPLASAVKTHTWWVVRRLLERGANPDLADSLGTTPLHWAARNDDVRSITLLLAAGATPAARLTNGNTPMNEAGRRGSANALQALLDHGLDPRADRDAHYPDGRTVALARTAAASAPHPAHATRNQACIALLERWELQSLADTLVVAPAPDAGRRRL